jgi:hypothetical protein
MLLLLAVVAAFTCTSVAQYGSSSSSAGQSAEKGGKPKKEATLTGCISAQPDANGNYTLSNAKHKKGVELEPADKVKEHAGHQTQLTGQWSADKKKFEVASLKHISETCEMAAGGGTAGMTKKGKKDAEKDTAAPPK